MSKYNWQPWETKPENYQAFYQKYQNGAIELVPEGDPILAKKSLIRGGASDEECWRFRNSPKKIYGDSWSKDIPNPRTHWSEIL